MAEDRGSTTPRTTAATGIDSALLDLTQAANYLGTSERHVRRLWQERRIAVVKVGRRVRFTRSDLDAFIERNRHHALR